MCGCVPMILGSSESVLFVILLYDLPLKIWQEALFCCCLSYGICPGVKQCHSFNWKFVLSTVARIYIMNYTHRGLSFWHCKPLCFYLLSDVIHTVGPIARGNVGQSQRDDLESCYKYSLKLMKDNNLRSVVSTKAFKTDFTNSPLQTSSSVTRLMLSRPCFEILKSAK